VVGAQNEQPLPVHVPVQPAGLSHWSVHCEPQISEQVASNGHDSEHSTSGAHDKLQPPGVLIVSINTLLVQHLSTGECG